MEKESTVLMVYTLKESDGPIIQRLSQVDIIELVEKHELTEADYAIIDGTVLKNFDMRKEHVSK